MGKSVVLALTAALFLGAPASASQNKSPQTVTAFTTMVGVDGGFVNFRVRGVLGDELPWEIRSVFGSLSSATSLIDTLADAPAPGSV